MYLKMPTQWLRINSILELIRNFYHLCLIVVLSVDEFVLSKNFSLKKRQQQKRQSIVRY